MIIGKLLNLEIEKDDEHLATTWQIATDYTFRNVIANSQDDTKNKTSIVFKDILPEPGREYYGRAMIRTRKEGWSVWHNLDISVSEKQDVIDNIYTLPSVIGIPRIKTTSDGRNTNVSNHPVTGFKISASGYATVNHTKHIATSWYLEDVNDKVIWKSENDTMNKDEIDVNDVILDYNKPYKIRACFHSETKDISDLSTLTVCTIEEKNIAIRVFLEKFLLTDPSIDLTREIELTLPILMAEGQQVDPRTICLYFNIYEYGERSSDLVLSVEVLKQDRVLRIPANTLKSNKTYILKYRVTQEDEWDVLLWNIW